ncbi:MAG: hypothetical protein DRJ35_08100, partial [Thermoprotei archaeon]
MIAMKIEKPKSIKMELNENRIFSLLADRIYKNELALLRELIQNSIDAGTNKVNINYRRLANGLWLLEIEDFGKSMSYEFLENDFKKVGQQFKSGNNTIGVYGIGRLSIWKLKNKLKHVFLIATTDRETTILTWISPREYQLIKTPKKIGHRGVIYRLILKGDINIHEIEKYLIKQFLLTDTPIYLNGELISSKKELVYEDTNIKIYNYETFWVKVYCKNLFVDWISIHLPLAIDFKYDITTLSRDSIRVPRDFIEEKILNALPQLLTRNREYWLMHLSKLVDFLYDKEKLEEFVNFIPVRVGN